jgi:hypothetical protein
MMVFLFHLMAGRLIPAPIHEGQTHPAGAGDAPLGSGKPERFTTENAENIEEYRGEGKD